MMGYGPVILHKCHKSSIISFVFSVEFQNYPICNLEISDTGALRKGCNMTVLVAQGNPCTKVIDGQEHEVVPFAGANKEGEFASFGVGYQLLSEGSGSIWGLVMPHMLIQSWRAMKLLERVPHINSGTLCACWYAASENPHSSDQRHIDELAAEFGGPAAFEALRAEILAAVPLSDELDAMLTIVRDRGVEVSVHELNTMVEAGKIPPHPIIDELTAMQEAKSAAHKAHEQFVEALMPVEESLGAFFAQLGIRNMIDGIPIGAYGMDWGHIDVVNLDVYVKRYSTGRYCSDSDFPLRHTTQGPDTRSANVGGGVRVYLTSFGEIEEPFVVAKDGTKYTFTTAAYRDGKIMVKTLVGKDGVEPEEGTYSVPELREMIGRLRRRRDRWHHRQR